MEANVSNAETKKRLEMYGIHTDFSDEMMSDDQLEEQGYSRMPETLFSHVNMLLQQIPDLILGEYTEGLYHVIYDKSLGELQRVKDCSNLFRGNVVARGSNNNIVDSAVLQAASNAPMVANMIFNAMSVITGQYFLAEINDKLSVLSNNIESVYQFLETEKRSRLRANECYLMQTLQAMTHMQANSFWHQATLNGVQKIRIDSLADIDFYSNIIRQKNEKLNAFKGKRDAVMDIIKQIKNDMSMYYYALYLYVLSFYLDTLLSGNTDSGYIDFVCREIRKSVADYQEQTSGFVNGILRFVDKCYNPNEKEKKLAMAGTALVINSLFHNPAVAVPILSILNDRAEVKKKDAKSEAEKLMLAGIEDQFDLEPIKAIEINLMRYDETLNKSAIELICTEDAAYMKSVPRAMEKERIDDVASTL